VSNIQLKEGAKLSQFLENVIMETARKHPDWVFTSNSVEEARKIRVTYKGKQELGFISVERKYVRGESTQIFSVDNWRIVEMRQRGSAIQTSKPKEALKAIEKYFFPLTDAEHIDKAFKHAYHLIHSELSTARHMLDKDIRNMQQPMMTFANNRWDEFLSGLSVEDRGRALDLLKHQQLYNSARALFQDIDHKKCLTVYLSDGKYTVQQGEVLQDYESDTLPEHIKTKVGLLKLVEEKEVIPEVGVRVGNLYVVRP